MAAHAQAATVLELMLACGAYPDDECSLCVLLEVSSGVRESLRHASTNPGRCRVWLTVDNKQMESFVAWLANWSHLVAEVTVTFQPSEWTLKRLAAALRRRQQQQPDGEQQAHSVSSSSPESSDTGSDDGSDDGSLGAAATPAADAPAAAPAADAPADAPAGPAESADAAAVDAPAGPAADAADTAADAPAGPAEPAPAAGALSLPAPAPAPPVLHLLLPISKPASPGFVRCLPTTISSVQLRLERHDDPWTFKYTDDEVRQVWRLKFGRLKQLRSLTVLAAPSWAQAAPWDNGFQVHVGSTLTRLDVSGPCRMLRGAEAAPLHSLLLSCSNLSTGRVAALIRGCSGTLAGVTLRGGEPYPDEDPDDPDTDIDIDLSFLMSNPMWGCMEYQRLHKADAEVLAAALGTCTALTRLEIKAYDCSHRTPESPRPFAAPPREPAADDPSDNDNFWWDACLARVGTGLRSLRLCCTARLDWRVVSWPQLAQLSLLVLDDAGPAFDDAAFQAMAGVLTGLRQLSIRGGGLQSARTVLSAAAASLSSGLTNLNLGRNSQLAFTAADDNLSRLVQPLEQLAQLTLPPRLLRDVEDDVLEFEMPAGRQAAGVLGPQGDERATAGEEEEEEGVRFVRLWRA